MAGEFIESLKCEITIRPEMETADHRYEYVFRNVGDEAQEDSFAFTVPNATVVQIGDVIAHDGLPGRNPTVTREPASNATRLIFSNLLPIAAGQSRVLGFSYPAPTSIMKHNGLLSNVAFYRAQLIHTYRVQVVTVIIHLPKRSKVIEHVGNATVTGTTIVFRENDLRPGELYTYPIFFSRPKPVAALLAGGATAVAGAGVSEAVHALLSLFGGG
jgi:hypothetical protein